MVVEFDAVYEGGVFRPTGPVDLPPGAAVRVTVVPPAWPEFDPDGPTAQDVLKHILDIPRDPGYVPGADDATASENVDKHLYGGPKGAL